MLQYTPLFGMRLIWPPGQGPPAREENLAAKGLQRDSRRQSVPASLSEELLLTDRGGRAEGRRAAEGGGREGHLSHSWQDLAGGMAQGRRLTALAWP